MNRAARHLQTKHPDRGDQLKLSKSVGVSQGYLSRLLSDDRRPGTKVRRRFWEACKVPMHWWDEPAEDAA